MYCYDAGSSSKGWSQRMHRLGLKCSSRSLHIIAQSALGCCAALRPSCSQVRITQDCRVGYSRMRYLCHAFIPISKCVRTSIFPSLCSQRGAVKPKQKESRFRIRSFCWFWDLAQEFWLQLEGALKVQEAPSTAVLGHHLSSAFTSLGMARQSPWLWQLQCNIQPCI